MSKLWRTFVNLFSKRKPVGKDPFGNVYYEEFGVHPGRSRRTVENADTLPAEHMDPAVYNVDRIPAQWRAWLAQTRYDPPTLEEVVEDMQLRQSIREKAQRLDLQWQQRKQELLKEEHYKTLVQKIELENKPMEVDFDDYLAQKHPTRKTKPEVVLPQGQGESFQPGEWETGTRPSSNK